MKRRESRSKNLESRVKKITSSFQLRASNFVLPASSSERGITLLLSVIVAAVLMISSFSAALLIVSQSRKTTDLEDSVQAFYSSESAIEAGLRKALNGGTVKGSVSCSEFNSGSGGFPSFSSAPFGNPPVFDDGTIRWRKLDGYLVQRTSQSTGKVQYFIRIQADGEARASGKVRRVVIDFSPDCSFPTPHTAPAGAWNSQWHCSAYNNTIAGEPANTSRGCPGNFYLIETTT